MSFWSSIASIFSGGSSSGSSSSDKSRIAAQMQYQKSRQAAPKMPRNWKSSSSDDNRQKLPRVKPKPKTGGGVASTIGRHPDHNPRSPVSSGGAKTGFKTSNTSLSKILNSPVKSDSDSDNDRKIQINKLTKGQADEKRRRAKIARDLSNKDNTGIENLGNLFAGLLGFRERAPTDPNATQASWYFNPGRSGIVDALGYAGMNAAYLPVKAAFNMAQGDEVGVAEALLPGGSLYADKLMGNNNFLGDGIIGDQSVNMGPDALKRKTNTDSDTNRTDVASNESGMPEWLRLWGQKNNLPNWGENYKPSPDTGNTGESDQPKQIVTPKSAAAPVIAKATENTDEDETKTETKVDGTANAGLWNILRYFLRAA